MKFFPVIFLLAALTGVAKGQVTVPDSKIAARSVSGQFVVYRTPMDDDTRVPPDIAANTNYVEIDPALLVVTCERLKQALQRELGAPEIWRGRVNIALRATKGLHDRVEITCDASPNGWSYRLIIPRFVERQHFTHALVQTMLLEQANRNATSRSAEIPLWLIEGLTQHLLGSREIEFLLPQPRTEVNGLTITRTSFTDLYNPLRDAYGVLSEYPPLTLEELSWPTTEQLTGKRGELYKRSAQLFVTELLRLQNGRECLLRMVIELGRCYNWQTAFFRAFEPHFARQLELEKWWALQVVHFSGHSPQQLWTIDESWRKLEQLMRVTIEVRRTIKDVPARLDVTFQDVIRQFEYKQQSPTLIAKLHDLDVARLRMAPDLIPLLDEYRLALNTYIQARDKLNLGAMIARGKMHPAAEAALKQLDDLDAKRTKARPKELRVLPPEDGTAAR